MAVQVTIDKHFGDNGEYMINPIVLWYIYTSDRGTNPAGFIRAGDGRVFSYAIDNHTLSLSDSTEVWHGGRQISDEVADTPESAIRIFTPYYEKSRESSEAAAKAYEEWAKR